MSLVTPAIPAAPVPVDLDYAEASRLLEGRPAEERVAWALARFTDSIVLSSSFGAQAAVMLHLVTRQAPKIPVLLVDSGYLFPKTYEFIDTLTKRLDLNLKVYEPAISPAWQEARYGKLWEQGLSGLETYNQINKVEPMDRALKELAPKAWFSGVRRQQSSTRKQLNVLAQKGGIIRVHPIIDWTDRDVFNYLKKNDLPYHPLWDEGYVSIGDWHSTRRLTDGLTEEETRFNGLKRECGLHENVSTDFSV